MSEQPEKTPAEEPAASTPPEGSEKKEAPKPLTIEDMKQQVIDMSADIMRARRETRKVEQTVKDKEAELVDLRRANAMLEKQVAEGKAQGFEKFAKELLTIADNMERALSHLPEKKLEDMQVNALATGVNLTAKQLTATFNKFGIHKIDANGKEFDPAFHEAIMCREKEGIESGHVTEVLQSGYTLNGKLLRPAKVSVAP